MTRGDVIAEQVDFDGLLIAFDDRVLRPRRWTQEQSRWAAELLAGLPEGPVLELCAGAGQIGLAAVRDTANRRLVAVDADPVAVDYVQRNAERAGFSDRVDAVCTRLDRSLDLAQSFPLVIADPPWVPAADTGRFPEDPLLAIDGGADGLETARLCLAVAERHLTPGGVLLLQLGDKEQADRLLAEQSGRLRLVELREYGDRGVVVRLDAS